MAQRRNSFLRGDRDKEQLKTSFQLGPTLNALWAGSIHIKVVGVHKAGSSSKHI